MSKLVIENVDDELVLKLQRQAVEHGVSVEEEHLRILSEALKHETLDASGVKRPSLIEFLIHCGEPWPDDFLPGRSKDTGEHRTVDFS
jgi:hypothetical protein